LAAFLSTGLSPHVWDFCVGGNSTGFDLAAFSELFAAASLLSGEAVLLWRGGTAHRWHALAVGLLTAGVLVAAWWLTASHPYTDCPPGG